MLRKPGKRQVTRPVWTLSLSSLCRSLSRSLSLSLSLRSLPPLSPLPLPLSPSLCRSLSLSLSVFHSHSLSLSPSIFTSTLPSHLKNMGMQNLNACTFSGYKVGCHYSHLLLSLSFLCRSIPPFVGLGATLSARPHTALDFLGPLSRGVDVELAGSDWQLLLATA